MADLGTIAAAGMSSSLSGAANLEIVCSYSQNQATNQTTLNLSAVFNYYGSSSSRKARWASDYVQLTGIGQRNNVLATYPSYVYAGNRYVLANSTVVVNNNTDGTFPNTYVSAFYHTSLNGSQASAGVTLTAANIPKIPRYPVMSISLASRTENSITINYSASVATPQYIHVYNGNTFLGVFYSSPFTITGLTPATTYGDIKVFGYANGGFGNASNSISVTTYPTPVTVSYGNVNNITATTCNLVMGSSNPTYTAATEFSIYSGDAMDSGSLNPNKKLQGPYTYKPAQYNRAITGLTQDTTYYAVFRVQTSDSGKWSDYFTTKFSTLAVQASLYFKTQEVQLCDFSSWYGKTIATLRNGQNSIAPLPLSGTLQEGNTYVANLFGTENGDTYSMGGSGIASFQLLNSTGDVVATLKPDENWICDNTTATQIQLVFSSGGASVYDNWNVTNAYFEIPTQWIKGKLWYKTEDGWVKGKRCYVKGTSNTWIKNAGVV